MNNERRDDKPVPLNCDRDPARWAREFNQTIFAENVDHLDEGLLIAWFANAMMCGEDTYRWRQEAAPSATPATEYICKCGVRVSPHRCRLQEDF